MQPRIRDGNAPKIESLKPRFKGSTGEFAFPSALYKVYTKVFVMSIIFFMKLTTFSRIFYLLLY